MANRYWVGGTGTWNETNTANWSTASGGAGGASAPGISDNVFIDANSGVGTITLTASSTGVVVGAVDFTGYTGTFAGSTNPGIKVTGNLTFSSGMTITYNSQLNLGSNGGGVTNTLTTNGKSLTSPILVTSNAADTWQLGSALTTTGALTVTQGNFSTANFALSIYSLTVNGTGNTVNLGTSAVTVSYSVDTSVATSLTFSGGSSTLNFTSTVVYINNVASLSLGTINFPSAATYTADGGNATLYGPISATDITFSAPSTSNFSSTLRIASNITLSGNLYLRANGTGNPINRILVASNTPGTRYTISANKIRDPIYSFTDVYDVDFRDIAVTGAANPVTGTRVGNGSNCTGITFTAAKTVYWVTAGSANWATTGAGNWSLSSGGAAAAANFPLAQDSVIFNATLPASGSTVTYNGSHPVGSLDTTARVASTATMTIARTSAMNCYGSISYGTGMTNTGGGSNFYGTGLLTLNTNGINFTGPFVVSMSGGTFRLLSNLTNTNNTTGAITLVCGTFDANNFNVTLSAAGGTCNWAPSNAGVRRLITGTGTWLVPGSNFRNIWNTSDSLGILTLDPAPSSKIRTVSTGTRLFGGKNNAVYGTIIHGLSGAINFYATGCTYTDIQNGSTTAANAIYFDDGKTSKFLNFTYTGSVTYPCTIGTINSTSQAILQKPTTWYMGANSTDGGNNTGLVFTAGGSTNYVTVRWINGTLTPASSNFFFLF